MPKASKLKEHNQKNFFSIFKISMNRDSVWKEIMDLLYENSEIFGFFQNFSNFKQPQLFFLPNRFQ